MVILIAANLTTCGFNVGFTTTEVYGKNTGSWRATLQCSTNYALGHDLEHVPSQVLPKAPAINEASVSSVIPHCSNLP